MLALVDDWGNPSPGRVGTDWFGFAALLLPEHRSNEIANWLHGVCDFLNHQPTRPLRFRNLNVNSKYHITRQLTDLRPDVSIVAVRIHEVTSANLHQRGWVYRYYGKEMVRVATHFAFDRGEQANIVFHRHEYLSGLEDYIWKKLRFNTWYMNKDNSERILFNSLASLRSEDDEVEPLLSLADCVANACHTALNPDDRWQQVNPTCINLLSDCLWNGPSYDKKPRLFGAILEPGGIALQLIPSLPLAIRQYWEH